MPSSSLAIGATLSNSGTVNIGNPSLTTATTVTATGLANTGTINLTGSATKLATLNIAGAAPATLGNFNIYGDALLQFASGAVGGIAAGTTLSLRDDPTANGDSVERRRRNDGHLQQRRQFERRQLQHRQR